MKNGGQTLISQEAIYESLPSGLDEGEKRTLARLLGRAISTYGYQARMRQTARQAGDLIGVQIDSLTKESQRSLDHLAQRYAGLFARAAIGEVQRIADSLADDLARLKGDTQELAAMRHRQSALKDELKTLRARMQELAPAVSVDTIEAIRRADSLRSENQHLKRKIAAARAVAQTLKFPGKKKAILEALE